MSTERCDLQQLYDWQKMLRDSVVIRSVLTKESSSTHFHIELIFMGEKQHIYRATAQRSIGKGHAYMNVDRYEGPMHTFLEDLFDYWFRKEAPVIAREWLKPVLHVASVNLKPNCWAFLEEASPFLMHYYGMIYAEIGPGNANDKYPPRENMYEADWHTFGRRFNAFLKQQEQLLFKRSFGKVSSS